MTDQPHAQRERLQLSYDTEIYGTVKHFTLPFVVAVVADLHGDSQAALWVGPLGDRKFYVIDIDNRDQRIAQIAPAVEFVGPEGAPVRLEFRSLADFEPQSIAEHHPVARDLLARRTLLAELHGRLLAHADLVAAFGALLAEPPPEGAAPPAWLVQEDEPTEEERARFALLLDEARGDTLSRTVDPLSALHARVLALDATIGRHVTEVLRAPAFRRLEGAWRGVDHLLHQLGPQDVSGLRVLSLRREELAQALCDEDEWLAERLIDEEFGTFAGQPFGLVVLGHEFDQRAGDIAMLQALTRLAARGDTFVLAAAAPTLLDADAHAAIAPARSARLQRLPEYAAWRALRADPASGQLALVVPRAAARERHALAGLGFGEFRYVEPPADSEHSPWMSGAYALAAAVLRTQVRNGWPAALEAAAGPVTLPGLPSWSGIDTTGSLRVASPLDAEFDAEAAVELGAFGLAVLGRDPKRTTAVLLSAAALQGGADLAPTLALDQVVRWLRCWARDRWGRWKDLAHCVEDLRALLASLTSAGASAEPRGETEDEGQGTPAHTPLLDGAELIAIRGVWRDPAAPANGRITLDVALRPALGFTRPLPSTRRTLTLPIHLKSDEAWALPPM